MAITTPEFHDLKSFTYDSPLSEDQILPYAIGFTKKDGFWWSLVLSYLFPVKDSSDFKVRLLKLCGGTNQLTETISEGQIGDLYHFLEKYNPFRNRYSCFHNTPLQNLVRKFEKNVCTLVGRERNITKSYEHCDIYLQTASRIFKRDILLCDVLDKNVKFFRFASGPAFSECVPLTLYKTSEEIDESSKFFCFGIALEVGIKLQKNALSSILWATNIYHKNVKWILNNISSNNNIILLLVNQNMYSEILDLFKQPHVLFKLEEAGYKVNPTTPDDQGNTALYYAIKSNKERVVHVFYNYLSGSVQLSGVSPRNPEESILTNLEHLRSVLDEHKLKFEDSMQSKRASVFVEELIKFNRFQSTVVSEFLNIETMDDIPFLSYKLCEVEKKKRKILSILATYENHFDFEDMLTSTHDSAQTSDLEKFITHQASFKKYERYHQILDFNAALFFFDNLFALKENLILENNAYESIETAFLSYILICSYYSDSTFFPSNRSRKRSKSEEGDKILKPKSRCCRAVYMQRTKLKKNLAEFKDLLSNTQVREGNVNKCVPESDLETVTSLPNIRDVIVFRAVMYYLHVVSKIEIKSASQDVGVDAQAVLVIERALQVVGEALNERYDGSASLGRSLFVSSLPIDIRKKLRDIRDQLSHVDGKKVECRKRIEACKDIFEGIKDELRVISREIEQNRLLLELMATKHVFLTGSLHRKEIQAMIRKNKDFISIHSQQRVTQLSGSIKHERSFCGMVMCAIRKEISSFSHHSNLQIHFSYINQYMFETQNVSNADRLAKILFHLSCVKTLFVHFFKEVRKESDAEKELTEILNQIENLAKSTFGEEEILQERTQETLKEREELVMRKYQEIYEKALSKNKFKRVKIKIQKSKRRVERRDLTNELQIALYNGHTSFQREADSSLSNGKYNLWIEEDSHRDSEEITGEEDKGVHEYPFIESLTEALNDFYPVTAEEKRFVMDQVPPKFKEHSKAKTELMQIFEDISCGKGVPEEKVRGLVQKLLLTPRKRKELQEDLGDKNNLKNTIDSLKSIKDYYGDMIDKLDNDDLISGADFVCYCTNLELPPEAEELLRKGVKGVKFRPKNDAVLNFLRDKIVMLEKILIKSDPTIDRMWSQVKSSKTKQHIIYRVKERYVRDSKVQAAVEMLLFDCMNTLKNRMDLKRLWIKASNLFSGLNLRNVLAHGNPLFEEVGRMLDPDDLPSEIVSKCLELVDDRNLVEDMCELLGRKGGTREDFTDAVKAGNEDLCDDVRRGKNWESYASLIPPRCKTENTSGVGKALNKRRRQEATS